MIIKEREVHGKPIKGMDLVLDRIYRARKIDDKADIEYQLAKLLPYQSLLGIDEACELLYQQYLEKGTVVIVGDYDVDGATATSVMVDGLREMGFSDVKFIIPNRLIDGYGLSPKLVDKAEKLGASLIITVDNGIVSYQGVDHAKSKGIKVLITDHHLASDKKPDAVIVNPNQKECTFESKAIAGVGVAFYVLIALRAYFREKGVFEKGPNLLSFLDLVALGTVADCVPLDFNNRNMVSQGLELMRSGKARPGIAALLKVAKRSPRLLEADDMGFSVAPRLNAAGRLEDMSIGVQCLLAKTEKEARMLAFELDRINATRRDMQKDMVEQALSYVEAMKEVKLDIAVVYNKDWHEGIIGLVASMIKEKFHIPSVVLTLDDTGVIKGSCRSIPGLNIRDLLVEYDRLHSGDLVKFGGHAMAAGLSLEKDSLQNFQKKLPILASQYVDEKMKQKALWVDGSLPSSHRTIQFAKVLLKNGPWGNGFEKPLFYDQFEICEQYLVGGSHLKVVLSDGSQMYQGIWFNIEEGLWPKHDCKVVDVVYQVQINEFNQRRQLQFLITTMIPK